jgi:hypothetical protein
VAAAEIKPGDSLVTGLLYRCVPNTHGSYDYNEKKAGKLAFKPDYRENGISVYRADLVAPAEVLHELDGYGVCQFTAEAFLSEVKRLRESKENDFDQPVTITFEPSSRPRCGHGHCYIEPMPGLIQKALYKRLARIVDGFHPGPAVAGRSARDGEPS